MRLNMRVFKERREVPQGRAFPLPVLEENAGTFFVSRFSLERGQGGKMVACGRSPKDLVDRMKSQLDESEPSVMGRRIPQISVTFASRESTARRIFRENKVQYDLTVRTEGLKGSDISEFFREMDRVLDNGTPSQTRDGLESVR